MTTPGPRLTALTSTIYRQWDGNRQTVARGDGMMEENGQEEDRPACDAGDSLRGEKGRQEAEEAGRWMRIEPTLAFVCIVSQQILAVLTNTMPYFACRLLLRLDLHQTPSLGLVRTTEQGQRIRSDCIFRIHCHLEYGLKSP